MTNPVAQPDKMTLGTVGRLQAGKQKDGDRTTTAVGGKQKDAGRRGQAKGRWQDDYSCRG